MSVVADGYLTLLKAAQDEYIVQKSRFLCDAAPCGTEEEALAFLQDKRTRYRDATPHCYAYVIGANAGVMRFSDDGEPSGTAGMPVLDVITKNGVQDVCVVVTRYFGGVLLGKGGLVRAYSQGAKLALEAGQVITMQSCLLCSLCCNYNQYGKVSAVVMDSDGVIDDTLYEADVVIRFHMPPELLPALNKKLADITAGEVQAQGDEEQFFVFE